MRRKRHKEREIAENYHKDSSKIKYTWPRTALMLSRIAESYKRLAIFLDIEDGIVEK